MQICLHGFVSGKVQGVSFRQHTLEEAERLDLNGWVRNLADGRVEVLVEGAEAAVRELEAWLESGPERARVDALELEQQPVQGITGFVIRR
ncbi:acylphosphatase [Pseudomonas sp. Gutcm_11s]|uniref:acylphosphatase n=1 Tax=Pseudomonas sp. Gutcm_11s TaxID=3026088 RepID=UPI00235E74B3|nr:acylphosphatase [Pseudomonas sp. Gutcm_11s]MDD0842503.1 acylphosphatase [Pseudomonas sp. Gutcm_11s]